MKTLVLSPAGRRQMRSLNEAWREIAESIRAFTTEEP